MNRSDATRTLGWFALAVILLLSKTTSAVDVEVRTGCVGHFASELEAAQVLGQKDDFIERLSPFDRAARLKTDQPVSEAKFLGFIKTTVQPWGNTEEERIQQALAEIRPALEKVSFQFPAKVDFIKTTWYGFHVDIVQ